MNLKGRRPPSCEPLTGEVEAIGGNSGTPGLTAGAGGGGGSGSPCEGGNQFDGSGGRGVDGKAVVSWYQ